MSGIICAVRGGPDSQVTIDEAISLALEANLPLNFLYVVNLDFLTHTQSSKTHTITDQLTQMGEFILLTAQQKAETRPTEGPRKFILYFNINMLNLYFYDILRISCA